MIEKKRLLGFGLGLSEVALRLLAPGGFAQRPRTHLGDAHLLTHQSEHANALTVLVELGVQLLAAFRRLTLNDLERRFALDVLTGRQTSQLLVERPQQKLLVRLCFGIDGVLAVTSDTYYASDQAVRSYHKTDSDEGQQESN